MKSITRVAFPILVFVCAAFCFSQTAVKSGTPAPAASAKPQVKPEAAKTDPASADKDEVIPPAEPNAIFPAVAARVNGKPILGRELESAVRRELALIGSPEWKNLRAEYRLQLTLNLFAVLLNAKLIYQKALASGIAVTEADVQAELQKITQAFKTDAEMNSYLASQMLDRASLEKSLYESIAISRYLDETINKKITVSPEELAKYYTSNTKEFQHPDLVRISQILISAGESASEDTLGKQRAEALLARVKKGEDFAKLAKENSTDPSASQGGDIGYMSRDALEPQYAEAAFSLPAGGLRMIRIKEGYLIIKVADKKKEGLSTLEEVKERLTEFLKGQKSQAEITKLVNQLREQAKIEIYIDQAQGAQP